MTLNAVTALLGTLAPSVQITPTAQGFTLTCAGVSVQATLEGDTLRNDDGVIAFTGHVTEDARVNVLHPLFTSLRNTLNVPLHIQERTQGRLHLDGQWRPTSLGLHNHHSVAVLTRAPAGVDAPAVWTDPTDLCAEHALDLLSALRDAAPTAIGSYL